MITKLAIKKVCKQYHTDLYNYILAMYYISNVKELGEDKCIVYCNMYINYLHIGCTYKDHSKIIRLCPENVKNVKSVPDSFLVCIK